MRLIEQVQPNSVLDVGAGNGEKLLLLACRFPEVEFHGINLAPGGVFAAQDAQKAQHIPDWLVQFSPEPLKDTSAHRRVRFQQASAKELPFDTGAMDLVYTSLAIEQMQGIKDEVLAEIGRVARHRASFFEAFRDFNRGGIQRLYIYAESCFRGELQELRQHGFRHFESFADLPQKLWMRNVHVLASK